MAGKGPNLLAALADNPANSEANFEALRQFKSLFPLFQAHVVSGLFRSRLLSLHCGSTRTAVEQFDRFSRHLVAIGSTSESGTYPVGTSFSAGNTWAVDVGAAQAACGSPATVVCFGTGATGTLLLPTLPTTRLVAFLSTPWMPSGLASADARCMADAASAGLSGTFRALLNNDATRFPSAGLWVRTDGAPVVADAPWSFPYGVLDLDAHGSVVIPQDVPSASVWIPAGRWGNFTTTEDCQNWVGGPSLNGSVERFDRPGSQPTTRPCIEAHRLYCFQVP